MAGQQVGSRSIPTIPRVAGVISCSVAVRSIWRRLKDGPTQMWFRWDRAHRKRVAPRMWACLYGETVHGSAWVGLQLLVHHVHHHRHSQRERWELGVYWVALRCWRNKGWGSDSGRSVYSSLPPPRRVLIILTIIEDSTQQLMVNFHEFLHNDRRVVVCHGVLSKLRCQALHVEVTAQQCREDPVGTISPARAAQPMSVMSQT